MVLFRDPRRSRVNCFSFGVVCLRLRPKEFQILSLVFTFYETHSRRITVFVKVQERTSRLVTLSSAAHVISCGPHGVCHEWPKEHRKNVKDKWKLYQTPTGAHRPDENQVKTHKKQTELNKKNDGAMMKQNANRTCRDSEGHTEVWRWSLIDFITILNSDLIETT